MQDKTSQSWNFHAVRFYENSQALCKIVADFLGEGLGVRLPAVVIATPEHSALIAVELHCRGFDADRLRKAGDLLMLDAELTLARFMRDGMPDPTLFNCVLTEVIDKACRGRVDCVIRAYGEMVDVLWKAGHTVAATKLEMLWNELAQTHDFSLLCGYAMGSFYKDAAVEDICEQHTHVLSASGQAASVS